MFALYLVVISKAGYWVTSPSTSPENHFFDQKGNRVAVSEGSTMDMALIRELFEHGISPTKILNIDSAFRVRLERGRSKLLPFGLV